MHGLRRLGLAGTAYAKAQCTTIRLKLLMIGARVRVAARKVWPSFSESYAHARAFEQILANLRTHPPGWRPDKTLDRRRIQRGVRPNALFDSTEAITLVAHIERFELTALANPLPQWVRDYFPPPVHRTAA